MNVSIQQTDPLPFVVVVVDDEPLIRMLVADELTDEGFIVIQAGNAADALAILETRGIDVHVLFTDINMPGAIDGLQLAHLARDQWPWIALLVASGKVRPVKADMPDGTHFLSKPYSSNTMMNHVRELAVAH